jgi:SAM-dependent methyltransferase
MQPCAHDLATGSRRFAARDHVTGERFEVGECRACGLVVTHPAPAPHAAALYYPPAYFGVPGRRRFPRVVELLQRLLYDGRARRVEALAGAPGRVLDIGCGRGGLLAAFRRRGWEPYGVELNEPAAAHARDVLGLPVQVGAPESWPWPDGQFDALALWHVLEHWRDPRAVLDRAHRLLRRGGVLLVGVPNFGSPEARLARAGWFHLDVPRHLTHFTPASLACLLTDGGFEVRHRAFLAPEYDVFSFVQSALNAAGLPHNLLYDLLRGRGARFGPGAGAAQALASLALAVPLGVIGVPATVALAAARRGSSITILAAKRA